MNTNKNLESKGNTNQDEQQSDSNNIYENSSVIDENTQNIKQDMWLNDIINHLIKSKAIFKSQQRDDPELTDDEKYNIAINVFFKSPSLFLSRFGLFLRKEDISYFSSLQEQNYEMTHYIAKLQRYFDKSSRQTDIRNRRYEALKSLIDKGEYFSETEMMKRNPLLYEQLIGQYMSEDEKRIRDLENVQSKTLSEMLLECFDRKVMKDLQDSQQDAEDCAKEEEDSDDESEKDSENEREEISEMTRTLIQNEASTEQCLWGEKYDDNKEKQIKEPMSAKNPHLSCKELNVLRCEFITNMYQHFLDGKDNDFDYSTVDDNESYDNTSERIQDAEDKYFDSEEPADISPEEMNSLSDSSEDELDKYMRILQDSEKEYKTAKDCMI